MPKRPSSENVYTFSDISCTIDSVQYNVSSIDIVLADNTIPMVRIAIDPSHKLNAPTEPASNVTFDEIKRINDNLQKAAIGHKPASLTLTVERKGTVDQKLTLTDWVCVGLGFGGVGPRSGIGLQVVIEHPLGKINNTLAILGNINQFNFQNSMLTKVANSANIVDGLNRALIAYSELKREPVFTSNTTVSRGACGAFNVDPKSVWDALKERIKAVAAALKTNLEWNTNDWGGNGRNWPLQDCLPAEYLAGVKKSIAGYLLGATTYNVMNLLLSEISNDFLVTLVPTYTRTKLQLTPAHYWMNPKLTIHEYETADVVMPATDSSPIAGVATNYSEVVRAGPYFYLLAAKEDTTANEADTTIVYVPPAFINDKDLRMYGNMPMLNPPRWLSYMTQFMQDGTGQSFSEMELAGSPVQGNIDVTTAMKDAQSAAYNGDEALIKSILQRLCQAYFRAMFKSTYQMQLSTRLMITNPESDTPDNAVIPGTVCRVLTDSGATFYDLYITQVTHTISVQAGVAGTEIVGAYVRSEKAYEGIVKTGDSNSMYSAYDS